MNRTAYVLDIGTSKTTCLAATKDEEGLRVISAAAVATRGVHKGRIKDMAQVAECAKAAIKKVVDESGAPTDGISVGVCGLNVHSEQSRGIRMMFPTGKAVHEEDLLHANEHSRQIKFKEGYEILHTLACEYRIDGTSFGLDPLGKSGTRLEAVSNVMSVSSAELKRLGDIVTATGYKVGNFVPTALASGLGSIKPEYASSGCLVIDFGAGTTSAAVFKGGSCAKIATVDVGGAHVTNDIAELIKLTKEDAEALKTANGHTFPPQVGENEVVHVKQIGHDQPRPFPRKVLSEIIESRVRETLIMLKDELLKGGFDFEGVKSVLPTGGGSLLPGLEGVIEQVFGVAQIKQVSPRLVGTNSRRSAIPEMSAALGIALFILEDEEEEELVPVAGVPDWKDRFRSIKSIFGSKS